jgi:DNA-binding FadR family transcriptional regulator
MLRSVDPCNYTGASMAKSAAERMASLRARQRRAGLATLTLVVPGVDTDLFTQLAARHREAWRTGQGRTRGRLAPVRRLEAGARPAGIATTDILRLRELLELTAIGLVIERMNPGMERRLRRLLEVEAALDGGASAGELQRFHLALGELAGDPTLQFLLRIALRATDERSLFATRGQRERDVVVARVKRLHRRIADALIKRNTTLADYRMRNYLAGLKDWLE